jgi:hypothetical protein
MTTNPDKFEKQYKSWVPIGTSASDAERIMREHDFRCERRKFPSGHPWDGPILACRRENQFLNRTWIVALFLKEDRVVGYSTEWIATDFLRIAPGS